MNNFLIFFSIFAAVLWLYYYVGLYLFANIREKKDFKGKIALIIPTYNENETELIDTINSVKNAKSIDKVLFVNDGSSNNVSEIFQKYLHKNDYLDNKHNQGKRDAQKDAVNHLINIYGKDYFQIFAFMDSDTILRKDSITKLVENMWDEKVGAVTSQILCRNKKDNIITKTISAMYWSSSNIWRQAPSNYGYMQVTNGQLTCYKAKPVIELLDKYTSQIWCNRKCSMSDDRWLTHHFQTDYNLKILYEKESIAYTYIPNTIPGAYKMFLRWKKGSLRETILVSKYLFKKPLLVIDCWYNNLISVFQMVLRVWIIILTIQYPIVLLYYILMISVISVIYGLEMLIENPKEIHYRIGYSLFNEFIYGWVIVHALLTIKNQGKWATR